MEKKIEELSLQERLLKVQEELKAPKGQYNSFGKYKYRSCEDILESVKPLLVKYNLTLTLNDELENIGERYYIKATAKILSAEKELEDNRLQKYIANTAYAREDESKKGMDGSQITGTASSYARKYALNGLFLIDDTKDADTDEYKQQQGEELTLKDKIKKYGQKASTRLQAVGKKLSDLTEEEMKQLLEELENEN